MNADNLLNILLFVKDIKTINSIYQTCKFNHDNHELSYFWIQKYKQDNLPLINVQNTFTEWLRDYDKLLKAHDHITYALSCNQIIINNSDIELEITSLPFRLKDAMYHFTPQYRHFEFIKIKTYNDTNSVYIYSPQFKTDFHISYKNIHEILLRLYYNNPNINLKYYK